MKRLILTQQQLADAYAVPVKSSIYQYFLGLSDRKEKMIGLIIGEYEFFDDGDIEYKEHDFKEIIVSEETMKAWKLVLTVIFALASVAAAAKTLEITVTDIRSDKGNVLAMAKVAGHEQPVYGMSPAKRGEVVVTLEGIDAETAEVSLLHDEDGDYKMKTGERGPAEGYAAKKCALPAERNAVTIRLRYPAAE